MEFQSGNAEKSLYSKLDQKEGFQEFFENHAADSEFLKNGLELLIKGHSGQTTDKEEKSGTRRISLDHLRLTVLISKEYQSSERKNETLQNLFRLGAAYSIDNILRIFNESVLRKLLFQLRMIDLNDDQTDILKSIKEFLNEDQQSEINKVIDELYYWIEILRAFGTEKAIQDKDENPSLSVPFEFVDIEDENWKRLIEISSNFGHALNSVFNIGNFFTYIQVLKEMDNKDMHDIKNPFLKCPRYLHYQARALKGFMQLLEGYKYELLGCDKEQTINNWYPVFYDIYQMLNSRSTSASKELAPLPVSIPNEDSGKNKIELRNVSENSLTRALFEIAKNAFNDDKADKETLKKMRLKGEPYLKIDITPMLDNEDNEMVCISFVDRGKAIDLELLQRRSGRRIGNLQDIIEILAERGVSIPVNESETGKQNKGIGLSEARSIIHEHNGELFCKNGRNGGVGFVVLIPKEGKKSLHRLKLSGSVIDVVDKKQPSYVKRETKDRFGVVFSGTDERKDEKK